MHRFRHALQRRPRAGVRLVVIPRRGESARGRGSWPVRLGASALAAIAVGAALEFFLDPRSGRRRRALVRARTAGVVRRRRRQLARSAHYEAGRLVGLGHAIAWRHKSAAELDDVSLVRKVESELFRDRSIPKGRISINSDRGVVVLRGALEDERQIRRIGHAARRIAGVREVENLLHAPGEPAPPSHPHGNRRSPRSAA